MAQENGMDRNSIMLYFIIEYLFVMRLQLNILRFHCLQTTLACLSQCTLYALLKESLLEWVIKGMLLSCNNNAIR